MIYAFTGKKQSGKSTASKYLMEKLPGAVRMNFKDGLVEEIKQNFPDLLSAIITIMDRTAYDGWGWTVDKLVEQKPPLFRTLLQNYGTEVRRKDARNYWVYKWLESVKDAQENIITDDVRFLNEADAVHRLGGIVIRIVRTDLPSTDQHSSETEMDQIDEDYTISVTTGEHAELYRKLDTILNAKKPSN